MSTVPYEQTIRVRLVTHAEAEELLSRQMEEQRNLRESAVRLYQQTMASGRWIAEASVIAIDTAGRLINGVHRLTAQVRGGYDVSHVVIEGASPRAALYIDQGAQRNFADAITIAGIVGKDESRKIANLATQVMKGAQQAPGYVPGDLTLAEKIGFVEANREPLRQAIAGVEQFGKTALPFGIQDLTLAWLLYQAAACGLQEQFHDFLWDVFVNNATDTPSPAWAVRRALQNGIRSARRPGPKKMTAIVLKGFIGSLQGRTWKQAIKWEGSGQNAEPYPSLSGWAEQPDDL